MSDGPAPKAPPPSLEFTHEEAPPSLPVDGPGRFTRPEPRQLPMWAKWVISLGVVVIALVVIVVYVSHHNTNDSGGQRLSPKGLRAENQEAAELQQQDQAPRLFKLNGGPTDISSVVKAVHVVMLNRINQREAGPPLEVAKCRPTTKSGTKQGYSCVVDSGSVNFDFVAVVDAPAKTMVLCKRDPPPAPSMNVPLDASCTPPAPSTASTTSPAPAG